MESDKYVKLKHVQELAKLYELRSSFYDWSSQYEQYTKKINNTLEWLERNAKEIEGAVD